jgi:hypothetical protein
MSSDSVAGVPRTGSLPQLDWEWFRLWMESAAARLDWVNESDIALGMDEEEKKIQPRRCLRYREANISFLAQALGYIF